jgi:hypothetical protein
VSEAKLKCNLARHLPSLQLQAVWNAIERLCDVHGIMKGNEGKPAEKWTRPLFYAAAATTADALNVSKNTARKHIRELVDLGYLIPIYSDTSQNRTDRGRYTVNTYEVMLHDQYSAQPGCECPPFRFVRIAGQLVVKDQLRKARPEQADRFPKREIHADTLSIVRMREAGASYQQIAEVLNMNKGWVHKLYKRASEPRDVVMTAS